MTKQNEQWKGWIDKAKEIDRLKLQNDLTLQRVELIRGEVHYDVELTEILLNEAFAHSVLCDEKMNQIGVLVRCRLQLTPITVGTRRKVGTFIYRGDLPNVHRILVFQYAAEEGIKVFRLLSKDRTSTRYLDECVSEFLGGGGREWKKTIFDTNTPGRTGATSQRIGKHTPRIGTVALEPLFDSLIHNNNPAVAP